MDNAPMPPADDAAMPPMDDNGGQSEFDTNFDAGVEADEDTDPKKFIQQLAGKLSQSLSTYNNENGGEDEELNKYVANMVVAQVAQNMDDADKKEVIKKINTAVSEEEPAEELPQDEEMPAEETPVEEPMQECFTKKQLKEALLNQTLNDQDNDITAKQKNKKQTPFDGKKLK